MRWLRVSSNLQKDGLWLVGWGVSVIGARACCERDMNGLKHLR
jgi:hypothetical protein